MDFLNGFKFTELKNSCEVVDVNSEKIGRLLDVIVKPSENGRLALSKFVVGGSRWEEILEDIGLKDDIDPVFPITLIEGGSSNRIKLTEPKDNLKSTSIDPNAIEEKEFKLSDLSKSKLIDKGGTHIGKIIDLQFKDGAFEFIIGESALEEWAEDVGLIADVDFLLKPKHISSINENEIQLDMRKEELESTFQGHLQDQNAKRAKEKSKQIRDSSFMYFP